MINLSKIETNDIVNELERRNGFMHKQTTVNLSTVKTLELLNELHERNDFGKGVDIKYVNKDGTFHMEVMEDGKIIQKSGRGPAMIIVISG